MWRAQFPILVGDAAGRGSLITLWAIDEFMGFVMESADDLHGWEYSVA